MKREDERARRPPEGDTDLGQTRVQMTGLSAFGRNPFGRERIFQSVKRRGRGGRGSFQSCGKQEGILELKFYKTGHGLSEISADQKANWRRCCEQ